MIFQKVSPQYDKGGSSFCGLEIYTGFMALFTKKEYKITNTNYIHLYRRADKSLALPGRKQATSTTLLTLAIHSKKEFRKLSIQPALRGSSDLRVGGNIANFHLFFSVGSV
jgi:hypothetical protein